MGVNNSVIVASPDGILVSDKQQSSYIKEYVALGFYIPTSLEYRAYGVDVQERSKMSEKDLAHINTVQTVVKPIIKEVEYVYDYFASNDERLHYRNTGRRLNSGESF
jgi:hypothetical protein